VPVVPSGILRMLLSPALASPDPAVAAIAMVQHLAKQRILDLAPGNWGARYELQLWKRHNRPQHSDRYPTHCQPPPGTQVLAIRAAVRA
jgi:hypothetical protein